MTPNPAAPLLARYLDWLPLSTEARQALLARATRRHDSDSAAALQELHQALAAEGEADPVDASVAGRLALAYGEATAETRDPGRQDYALRVRPPLKRASMPTEKWPTRLLPMWLGGLTRRLLGLPAPALANPVRPDSPDPRGHWHEVGARRRGLLLGLVVLQTTLATYYMSDLLPAGGSTALYAALLVLFAALNAWVSAGFWTALMGFMALQFGWSRHTVSARTTADVPIADDARTAIVMPICNEHVARVFAGLRATYDSLDKTGNLAHFDFFVLSDSSDPDIRVAETAAWKHLCREVGGLGRIFYRWRQHRVKRKSGNIADFCRRWGSQYRYMIILDADSVMSGDCVTRLVQMMEANPSAGIIQTAPRAAGRDTLYSRLQQFANRVYGPLFVAGLHFWQLGESHYWGHNAILRVAPFMRHCSLDRLPGQGSLAGDILSHDFVEAALMRRAGWAVWIAYDLAGSYEEMPPNLIDELQRDRRWCHGNLMNFRLFLTPGFHPAHRAVFLTGAISYMSAAIWFVFLLLSTLLMASHSMHDATWQESASVVPALLVSEPAEPAPAGHAMWLFGFTAIWLFLPKVLSVLLILNKEAPQFGGALRLMASVLLEWLFSILLAPVRMLFHTQFVVAGLTGWSVQWLSPAREDLATDWRTAARNHGWHTLLGVAWALTVYSLNPAYLWWMSPIVGALMLSIPLSVLSSRAALGRRLRAAGLLLIPEERTQPEELRQLGRELLRQPAAPDFVSAIVDPTLNALLSATSPRPARRTAAARQRRQLRIERALAAGPAALGRADKLALLNDAEALTQLHFAVWSSAAAHPDWFRAAEHALPRQPAATRLLNQPCLGT